MVGVGVNDDTTYLSNSLNQPCRLPLGIIAPFILVSLRYAAPCSLASLKLAPLKSAHFKRLWLKSAWAARILSITSPVKGQSGFGGELDRLADLAFCFAHTHLGCPGIVGISSLYADNH